MAGGDVADDEDWGGGFAGPVKGQHAICKTPDIKTPKRQIQNAQTPNPKRQRANLKTPTRQANIA